MSFFLFILPFKNVCYFVVKPHLFFPSPSQWRAQQYEDEDQGGLGRMLVLVRGDPAFTKTGERKWSPIRMMSKWPVPLQKSLAWIFWLLGNPNSTAKLWTASATLSIRPPTSWAVGKDPLTNLAGQTLLEDKFVSSLLCTLPTWST